MMESESRLPGLERLAGACLCVLLALVAAPHDASADLKVHFIDVGQGDAILLDAPDGTVLVDAGEPNGLAAGFLAERDIDHLDLVVATHAHFDHIGGFLEILPEVGAEQVWYNGQSHTTQAFEDFTDILLELDAAYHEPARGETETFGRLRIEVLHPTGSAAEYDGHLHDKSIVLRAVYGDVAIMLTGDAEAPVERDLVQAGLDLQSDVLKLGHHGSRTSTTPEFVSAVAPALAVYQAGVDNRYGHPHEEPLQVLADAAVDVIGTDTHGMVKVITDGQDFEIAVDEVVATVNADPGCVDLNTASTAELMDIIHIHEVRSEAIVELRPWSELRQLTRISGIGLARLSDIKEQGIACVDP